MWPSPLQIPKIQDFESNSQRLPQPGQTIGKPHRRGGEADASSRRQQWAQPVVFRAQRADVQAWSVAGCPRNDDRLQPPHIQLLRIHEAVQGATAEEKGWISHRKWNKRVHIKKICIRLLYLWEMYYICSDDFVANDYQFVDYGGWPIGQPAVFL